MERQTVIDNIEKVISNINNINGFMKTMDEFTSEPRSKKEIKAFCERCILDVFLDAVDLKFVYSVMTVEATRTNCIELTYSLFNQHAPKTDLLVRSIKRGMDRCIQSVLLLISETVNQLNKDNTPELAYQIIQINKTVCLLRNIFNTPRDVPLTEQTLPAFQQSYEGDDYLHESFDKIIKETQTCFTELSKSVDAYALIQRNKNKFPSNPYLCLNNWLSLKAFMLYIDTL